MIRRCKSDASLTRPSPRASTRTGFRLVSAGLLAVASLVGCLEQRTLKSGDRYDRYALRTSLAEAELEPGLLLGVFPLAKGAIVDGDTIKVDGLDASLRLLAIDTEETFKSKKKRALYDRLGFDGYLEAMQAETDRPVKCATPMGEKAKVWAEEFFRGVRYVRLERDHPKEIRGRFGRHLTYVFVERNGTWVNYNIEAVRAGMTPYFTKYAYSRRFHDEFIAAQDEARAAQRGIWDPNEEAYRDYDVRLAWWNARADYIRAFEEVARDRDDLLVLTYWDTLDLLSSRMGEEVELLAAVSGIRKSKGSGPTRVLLSRRMFSDFPLIFFDDEVLERSQIVDASGEFIRVRGTVSSYTYRGKRQRNTDRTQLQIEVKYPQQIQLSGVRPPSRSARAPTPPPPDLSGRPDFSRGVKGGMVQDAPSPDMTRDDANTPKTEDDRQVEETDG